MKIADINWGAMKEIADVANMLRDMGHDALYSIFNDTAVLYIEGSKVCDDTGIGVGNTRASVIQGPDNHMSALIIENHEYYIGIAVSIEDIYLLKGYLRKMFGSVSE